MGKGNERYQETLAIKGFNVCLIWLLFLNGENSYNAIYSKGNNMIWFLHSNGNNKILQPLIKEAIHYKVIIEFAKKTTSDASN